MITPGLIDLQVNGYAGVDFNDAGLTADALDHALAAMLRDGVTACLPTLITAGEATLAERLQALDLATATSRLGPDMVPGYHLEGPFLNPAPGYRGCHPADCMVAPDVSLLRRLTANLHRPVLLMTLAPELPGALALIEAARASGIVVAMGHTMAGVEETRRAVAAGVRLSTHLGNALPQPQPKFLNPLMAQLAEDGLHASFIADGIHVPVTALKVLLRAKTPARAVLVSDATAAAASPPACYGFAGMTIEHGPDGRVRVPGTATLAGSALRLDQAVRNLIAWGLADVASALAMVTASPAAVLAPALAFHGLSLPPAQVQWSDSVHAERVIDH